MRLTDKYDVPMIVGTAIFWGLMVLVAGGIARAGWELMGSLVS